MLSGSRQRTLARPPGDFSYDEANWRNTEQTSHLR
ncbi:MAG: hypothetical protein KatS3mg110_0733 [Pirellulaceae bacterium]|nr:MAG: hypothetical protein KatS3mg110_0733 [Pirellulaceae bacterium]